MILDMMLNESTIDTGLSDYSDVEPTSNGYEPSLAGMNQILMESAEDMHTLQTACSVAEYKALTLISESSVSEAIVLQEGVVSGFFKKMKELFNKMLAKIREFFSNVKLYFSKLTKDDNFLKQYKDELGKVTTSGFEYEGYNYTLDAIKLDSINADAAVKLLDDKGIGKTPEEVVNKAKSIAKSDKKDAEMASLKEFASKQNEEKEKVLNKVRSSICGEEKASEFKSAVFKKLRGGKDSKEKISVNVNDIIKTIELKDRTLVDIDAARKAAENNIISSLKFVDNCISKLNSVENSDEAVKSAATRLSQILNVIAGLRKSICDIVNSTAGYKVSAAKENCSQARDIARKLLIHDRKSRKSTNVNASFDGSDNVLDQFLLNN